MLVMVVVVMVMTLLPIRLSRAPWLGPMAAAGSSPDGPPEPASLFLRPVPLALLECCAQPRPPFVFLFPVLGPVEFPILAEIRGERFGEEEQLDVIPPRRQILVPQGVLLIIILLAFPPLHHITPPHDGRSRRREKRRIREQHAQPAPQLLAPPPPLDHHDLRIHDAQPAIRDADPPSRPPDPALPLPCSPDQHPRHDAAHQRDFFRGFDDPVDGAADAGAVLAGAQEEEVGEEAEPEGEEEEEEGVLPAAVAEVEVLGPKRGFEDEEVEVDLRGGGGEDGEWV